MTLRKLTEGLVKFLEKHPEFADREVYHSTECGYSSAGFESPLTIAVPILNEEIQDTEKYIFLVSNDDGYRTDNVITDWKFYS